MAAAQRMRKTVVGKVFQYIIQALNGVLFIAGILITIMVFALQKEPDNVLAWCVVSLGVAIMVTALFGVMSPYNNLCYKINIILSILSTLGNSAFTIAQFTARSKVIYYLNRDYDYATVDKLFSGARWAFLALIAIQVMSAIIGYVYKRYIPIESYENLEEEQQRRQADISKLRKEFFAKEYSDDKSKASSLAAKLKDKYGKWSHEEWANNTSKK